MRKQCCRKMHHRHFEDGETVFREGEYGEQMWIVIHGEVRLTVRDHHVVTVRSGEMLGEAVVKTNVIKLMHRSQVCRRTVPLCRSHAFREYTGE